MSALSQQSEKGTQIPPNIRNQLMIWLLIVVMMIFCMVIIGGITRLTGSGLSMVEWRPLMGTLPPLSDLEWARVFKLYQASPQYQQVNDWMTLSDFKWIFFWEYLHRLFGRLIGLVFALPWLYFLIKGALKGTWLWRSTAALLLGGSQGLLGWYMVKSGLVDMPQVSHFRLAAHLCLAFFCGQWVWSMLIDLKLSQMDTKPQKSAQLNKALMFTFLGILIVQIVYGAFMAGSRAGYLYTTYPTMNGAWLAPSWFNEAGLLSFSSLTALFNHPDSIHFIHRHFALVVLSLGSYLVWQGTRSSLPLIKTLSQVVGLALLLQFILGVLTITSGMNITLAAAHQGGSFILLTATVSLIQCSLRLTFPNTFGLQTK